jgi:phosphatidylserine/phosphatidylglycerophosphate/cardiolipin synthase-like enzyme
MAGEAKASTNWRGVLITGLAYGGGLMVGNVLSQILFSILSPEVYGKLGEGVRLLIGIVVVMVITGLGGAIGGFLGGWTLPVIGKPKGKYGFAWRSAISVGVVYGTFLLVAIFGLSMLTMRDAAFMPVGPFMNAYLFVGLIFGAIFGAVLGFATVGWRKTGSVFIAGVVGFALGGAALGVGIWAYLGSAPPGGLREGTWIYLLLGLFAFGFLGGLAIGFAFDRLARRDSGVPGTPLRPWIQYALFGILGLVVILVLIQLRPIVSFAADILTPRAALQTKTIAADSVGTHWIESSPISAQQSEIASLDLGAGSTSGAALVWPELTDSGVDVLLQLGSGTDELAWGSPINVSNTSDDSFAPSIDMDGAGGAHVAWLEGELAVALYALCSDGECADPEPLATSGASCPSGSGSDSPSVAMTDIAVSPDGSVMAVWTNEGGGLHYRALPDGLEGCVPLPEGTSASAFSLSSKPSAGYSLAFDDLQGSVWLTGYSAGEWDASPPKLGSGVRPGLNVDKNGSEQVAWCGEDTGVQYWFKGQAEALSQLTCLGTPSVATDQDGLAHITWQSGQVEDILGSLRQENVLYESIGDGETWTEPAIVAILDGSQDYGMVSDAAGSLHLAWTGAEPPIHYARQTTYECDPTELVGTEAKLYEVASLGGFRPDDDVIPFCQNQYETIVFTPRIDPIFSDARLTPNGAYDDYARLAQEAEYEVLFTTMAYEKAVNKDSPGAVLAKGVVDLYERVKANPELYPRGMRVRIMLGNSPSPSFEQLEMDAGLWYVINDLREAGLEKMVDPEIGWQVEVGNFAGRWPHSHVKTLIIDGETVVASGFNHEYKPLSKLHRSGKGKNDTDTGIVVTGPIAQHSRTVYDQLWTGAILRHCPDLTVSEVELRVTCTDSLGVPDHVPEVMRYSPTENEAVAFSMFRNQVYNEADQQLLAAYLSAEESIDLAQAMFSMPLICNLNHFFEVCDWGQALPYMEALMDAAENGADLRIVLTPYPIQSVENVIAMEIFNQEAFDRGLSRRVEIRMLDDLLHSKSAMIDGEFVIVGSQNLHWSAYGEGNGLSEYSLGVGDPAAAEQYQRFFDFLWERSPSRLDSR